MNSMTSGTLLKNDANTKSYKQGFRLAFIATLFAGVVILLGAFTRLADAGLGCPDWPGCYGHLLWPNSAEEIMAADEKFPHAPVAVDKTWPEMIHRYCAGTIGLLILALTYINIRERKIENQPVKLSIALLAMVILQGAFGMWTVTLKLWPQVVTAHLLGGFATLSLLWLMTLRLMSVSSRRVQSSEYVIKTLKPWSVMAIAVVIVQIFLGGWTSSNYAALACLDFPTCHGTFSPAADYVTGFDITQSIGPNYLGGLLDGEARTAIHVVHRVGALVTAVTLLLLSFKLFAAADKLFKRMALVVMSVLTLQIILGMSNVLFFLPLPVAVAHNGVAALLLLTVVTVCYFVFTTKPVSKTTI